MFNPENTALAYLPAPSSQIATAPTFTANRKTLLAAMVQICATIEKRNTIPCLSNVMFTTGNGGPLQLIGTDLDIEYKVAVPTSGDWLDFHTTLPAHQVCDLLKKSKSESVTFTIVTPEVFESGRVKIEFEGGATTTLQSLTVAEFPDLWAIDAAFTYQVEASEIAAVFGLVSHAISTEETRYYLNGIYLSYVSNGAQEINGLCATATDGHRLAHKSIKGNYILDARHKSCSICLSDASKR